MFREVESEPKSKPKKGKPAREAIVHFLRSEREPVEKEGVLRVVSIIAKHIGDEIPRSWDEVLNELIADGEVIFENGCLSLEREETERKEAVKSGYLF